MRGCSRTPSRRGGDDALAVEVRRYNDRDDRFVLATLARAFLRSAQWLP